MITELEITLQAALSMYGLRELPDEWNPQSGNKVIDGIALVTKIGGIREYCKIATTSDGGFAVKKDFGKCARIISIDKVYPVNVLEKRHDIKFHNDAEIVTFLRQNGHKDKDIEALLSKDGKTPEQIDADRATIDRYVNAATIETKQKMLKEEERCKEISAYSKRIKAKKNEERETAKRTRKNQKSDNK